MPRGPGHAQQQAGARKSEATRQAWQSPAAPTDLLATLPADNRREQSRCQHHIPCLWTEGWPCAGGQASHQSSSKLDRGHVANREPIPAQPCTPLEQATQQRMDTTSSFCPRGQRQGDEGRSESPWQEQKRSFQCRHMAGKRPRSHPQHPRDCVREQEKLQKRAAWLRSRCRVHEPPIRLARRKRLRSKSIGRNPTLRSPDTLTHLPSKATLPSH